MSVSDLQKLGLLRPESEWDRGNIRSYVPIVRGLFLATMAIGGCVMLALGNGGVVSWIGLLIFVLALIGFVWMNIVSVKQALSQPDTASNSGESDET